MRVGIPVIVAGFLTTLRLFLFSAVKKTSFTPRFAQGHR
jgi:hypothetical protein